MSVDQVSEPAVVESPETKPTPSRLREMTPTRRFLLKWLPVLLLIAGGFAWLLSWWSPVPVREVIVVGSAEDSVAAIKTAAGEFEGRALRDVEVDEITARVSDLPGIQGVDLVIQRPWTVAIVVDERHAVAQVKAEGGYQVVDSSGDTIRISEKKVKRLPLFAGDPGSQAIAVAVLNQLPESLARRLVSVSSTSDGRTEVVLRRGMVIKLGTADSIARKAEVAESLMRYKPKTINVSVPERPALTGTLKLPPKNREPKE